MSRLWKDLPPEILENVLACLPIHVLCRFRLVCKKWNHLVTQPGFASLCAHVSRRASYVLITHMCNCEYPYLQDQYLGLLESRRNWEVLDLAENRFYTLMDSFITDYLSQSLRIPERFELMGWHRYTLATDGGLIYAMYICYSRYLHIDVGTGTVRCHMVCNPMSKDFHQIIEPNIQCSYAQDIIVMSVDNTTQSYKIITMEVYTNNTSRQEEVHLYDSTTTKWRKLCKVPDEHRAYSSIFLKGIFYTLFVDTSLVPWCPKLYSCGLENGAWTYIDVELPPPSCLQDKSQLVVSLGRLFFVEYTGLPIFFPSDRMTPWETLIASNRVKKKLLIKVTIWEISLGEKKVMKIADMPKYSKYPQRMLYENNQHDVRGDAVVALGCGDSIVFSSLFRQSVRFDLLRNCWHELPTNARQLPDMIPQGIYAGLLDLDLRKMTEICYERTDKGLTT